MNNLYHDDTYVKNLFDNMGATYSLTNLVSSFGFSEIWRFMCVRNAKITSQSVVCDMMAGSGECWRYIPRGVTKIVSIDFSAFMVNRQRKRAAKHLLSIDVLEENATDTSIEDSSVDHIISAFGLKTLSTDASERFFHEVNRILKPGGTFSLLEISIPRFGVLRVFYSLYLSYIIPTVGKIFLGDVDCYRMLGRYTASFGSCESVGNEIEKSGLSVEIKSHFFGCATSLVGTKPV